MLNSLNNLNVFYIHIYNVLTFLTIFIYIYLSNKNNFFNQTTTKSNALVWLCLWLLSSLPVTSLFILKLVILLKNTSNLQTLIILIIVNITNFLIMYFIFTQTIFSRKTQKIVSFNEYKTLYIIFFFLILNFFYPYFIVILF